MEVNDVIKEYLEKLNDGINMYEIKGFTFPDTDFEIVDYTVENRNLGFHIMGKLPLNKKTNNILLELHNFIGRKINQDRLKEIFTFECAFTSQYSANVYFNGLTEEQVIQFFLKLDNSMKTIKEEFPFTGDEYY